jgi:hypothetical protein
MEGQMHQIWKLAVLLILAMGLAPPAFATIHVSSPSGEVHASWERGSGEIVTFYNFETNKVLKTYNAGFRIGLVTFSLNGQTICIYGTDPDDALTLRLVILDTTRQYLRVASLTSVPGGEVRCVPQNTARNPALPLQALTNRVVVVNVVRPRGPICSVVQKYLDSIVQYWDPKPSPARVVRSYTHTETRC